MKTPPAIGDAEVHEPLSLRMARLLDAEREGEAITLNRLLEGTAGRGLFLVIILLCIPFIAPVSIPGASIPFGLTIAFLGYETMHDRPPRLPRRLGDRPLPKGLRKLVLGGGMRVLGWIERLVRPRRSTWLSRRPLRILNGLLIMFWGCFLALPFPPMMPPLGNMLPSYAIILFAASMMEEDGVLIFWSYLLTLANLVYFAFWAELILGLFHKWGLQILQFLGLAA